MSEPPTLKRRGLKEWSEDELATALAGRPGWAAAHALWARAALLRAGPALALERLDAFDTGGTSDDLTPVHMTRYEALRALGSEDVVDRELTRLVEAGDATRVIWMAWARTASRRKDAATASRRFDVVAARFPDSVPRDWHVERVKLLLTLDRVSDARDVIRDSIPAERAECREALPEAGDLTIDALAMGGVLVGDAFLAEAITSYQAVTNIHSAATAIQHIRNIFYACSYNIGPPAFVRHFNASTRASGISGLRLAMKLFDVELLEIGERECSGIAEPGGRVLIIASYLPSLMSGPHFRFVSAFAAAFALSDSFAGVDVLITNEWQPEGPKVHTGPIDMQRHLEWRNDIAGMIGARAGDVRLHWVERDGPVHPQSDGIAKGMRLAPSLLVSIEGVYESPVVGRILARHLPTISIPTGSFIDEPAHADLVLSHGCPANFLDKPTPARWTVHRLPVIVLDREGDLPDASVMPAAAVRIVTAVGGGRMDKAIHARGGDLLHRVVDLLDQEHAAGWALIGIMNPEKICALTPAAFDRAGDRLKLISVIENFRTSLAQFDIFFHPDGETGGAMGIAMAVAEGVAVVAPRHCDAANFLPLEWLYDERDDGFALLRRLLAEPDLRSQVASAQRTHLERHTIPAVARSLPAHVENAQKRFVERHRPHMTVPLIRPDVPEVEAWAPLLSASFQASHFTNFGPLETRFANHCRDRYASEGYEAVPVTNATAGLTAALTAIASGPAPRRVAIPAFTFAATLHAVLQAGMEPVLCDVDPERWEISLGALEELFRSQRIDIVLPVRPFGLVRDQTALLALAGRHGAAVVIDGAAAFGHPGRENRIGSQAGEVEVVSLHATKAFSVGEGGIVFAPAAIARRVKSVSNFGFAPDRSFGDGGNMKMDDVHAAIGLAMLDRINGLIEVREAIARQWEVLIARCGEGRLIAARDPGAAPWQSYPILFSSERERQQAHRNLAVRGIESRRYYYPTLNAGYSGGVSGIAGAGPFPVAESLAARMLCVPVLARLSTTERAYLFEAAEQVLTGTASY